MIAYHASNKKFDKFSMEYANSGKHKEKFNALWFSTDKDYIKQFGNIVYKVEITGNFLKENQYRKIDNLVHEFDSECDDGIGILETNRGQEFAEFLKEKGIAFFDTAMAVNRLKDNASDAFLEIVERTDIRALLAKMPHCKTIATTGEKATVEVCNYFNINDIPSPNTKITLENDLVLYRLPSSSRAYPLAFEKKAEAYRGMFEEIF